eukprot:TRINITY_DN2729_c0_g1_i2.p1 TRINITY_DN2729_c0_g1~~TRINITY_DN2729_c0_g1_i2.p1  ORF type:complete len:313 (+),score=67.13 TRINITY_DN2729_c0_g1_i2:127-1065(+)
MMAAVKSGIYLAMLLVAVPSGSIATIESANCDGGVPSSDDKTSDGSCKAAALKASSRKTLAADHILFQLKPTTMAQKTKTKAVKSSAKDPMATVKVMSYNLFGWNAFNVNRWKSKNVLGKIKHWSPSVLGSQEVEKGGSRGYNKVKDQVISATGLRHGGGSQFYSESELEAYESADLKLIGGYWMSMRRYKIKSSGKYFLFFNSHWKHNHGLEQAGMIASAIDAERKKFGNPPTILVGDTNQFCIGFENEGIQYLLGEYGRVDFILATKGEWMTVNSTIDRDGMGYDGTASDHAALFAELEPIKDLAEIYNR